MIPGGNPNNVRESCRRGLVRARILQICPSEPEPERARWRRESKVRDESACESLRCACPRQPKGVAKAMLDLSSASERSRPSVRKRSSHALAKLPCPSEPRQHGRQCAGTWHWSVWETHGNRPASPQQPNLYLEPKWLRYLNIFNSLYWSWDGKDSH